MLSSPGIHRIPGTRIRAAIVMVVLAAAPLDTSAQQTTGTGARIRGTVTAAETGRPLRRVVVRLLGETAPGPSTATDANGVFEFRDVPAGRFTIVATKLGFVGMAFGQASFGAHPTRVQIAPGQRIDSVHISLPRGGVLSGRVFDEYGDPMPEALVHVWRAQYVQGIRRLMTVRTATANDIGQFRLPGLPPGTYYLSGTLRSSDAIPGDDIYSPRTPPPGGTGFAQTFYPFGSASDARPILMELGQEIANLEFSLQPVRLTTISGRVVNSSGRAAANMAVWLNHANPNAVVMGDLSRRMTTTDADGAFKLTGINPGDYRLDVRATAELEAIAKSGRVAGTPQGADAAEFASVPISVAGEDLEAVSITTSRGHVVSGRVRVESGAFEADVVEKIRITAFETSAGAAVSGLLLMAHAPVQPDLTFQLRGLVGTRLVRVEGLPAGWALKAVRVAGSDVTDTGIEIRLTDVSDVEVVLSRSTAVIGTVVDSKGQPAGDRTVLVFAEDPSRWTGFMNRYVASIRTSQDGSFRILALPPGRYFAAVVGPTADSEWLAPENLERLRGSATKLTLAEREQKPLHLTVQ